MKRLIKADLTAILRLAGECQPIEADRLDMSLSKLCRQEFSDYLFLARRGWCGLFDFPAIYEKDSYANLCWTARRAGHRPAAPCGQERGGTALGQRHHFELPGLRGGCGDIRPSAPGPAGTAYQADPAPVSSQSPVLLRPGSH